MAADRRIERDLEAVIAEAVVVAEDEWAEADERADRRRFIVTHVLAAVREYLLSDEAVERASRKFKPGMWGPHASTDEVIAALNDARAALSAALGEKP